MPQLSIIWLVSPDPVAVDSRAAALTAAGYRVIGGPWSAPAIAREKAQPPAAVIVDLSRSPSFGRDVAIAMRSHRALLTVPFLLAGGTTESVARIKSFLPDAVEADWHRMPAMVRAAIGNPPRKPARQLSVFAAYEGTPLPKKLGIKAGSAVALVNAPPRLEDTLGPLPEGARLSRNARGTRDLTLWFARSDQELNAKVAAMVKFADRGSLWIMWSKTAKAGLNQVAVRKAGLACGLVDFKISRIDDEWAGLRFTQRR